MWSLGCIFAELLGHKPLFKGRDCKLLRDLLKHVLLYIKSIILYSRGSIKSDLICTWYT